MHQTLSTCFHANPAEPEKQCLLGGTGWERLPASSTPWAFVTGFASAWALRARNNPVTQYENDPDSTNVEGLQYLAGGLSWNSCLATHWLILW